jgi:hypothetical protein
VLYSIEAGTSDRQFSYYCYAQQHWSKPEQSNGYESYSAQNEAVFLSEACFINLWFIVSRPEAYIVTNFEALLSVNHLA